jgi:hypothetical protein
MPASCLFIERLKVDALLGLGGERFIGYGVLRVKGKPGHLVLDA